jgi:hypothetical protein
LVNFLQGRKYHSPVRKRYDSHNRAFITSKVILWDENLKFDMTAGRAVCTDRSLCCAGNQQDRPPSDCYSAITFKAARTSVRWVTRRLWKNLVKCQNEHRGRVVGNPASYSEDTGFKYRPTYRLYWLCYRGFPQSNVTLHSHKLIGASFCIHLKGLDVWHFRMFEATGLKIMAPRSPSMAWPSC